MPEIKRKQKCWGEEIVARSNVLHPCKFQSMKSENIKKKKRFIERYLYKILWKRWQINDSQNTGLPI